MLQFVKKQNFINRVDMTNFLKLWLKQQLETTKCEVNWTSAKMSLHQKQSVQKNDKIFSNLSTNALFFPLLNNNIFII